MPVNAAKIHKEIEYLEDGSYFETIIVEQPSTQASGTKLVQKLHIIKMMINKLCGLSQ